jgi:hypothetical protein
MQSLLQAARGPGPRKTQHKTSVIKVPFYVKSLVDFQFSFTKKETCLAIHSFWSGLSMVKMATLSAFLPSIATCEVTSFL